MNIQNFKKKPVIVNAMQYLDDPKEIIDWIRSNGYRSYFTPFEEIIIETLEGDMKCNKNDWVIQGVHGEFYPCKPDIFEKTYEVIE